LPFVAVSSFTQVYKVALLYILMRFPVRGEELQRVLPKGSNPRCGVPEFSESPQGICRSKERCRGIEMRL
jgi:hypothetical protein